MKRIVFGPVVHEDKSYAYSLGFAACMMGHGIDANPYPADTDNNGDFQQGYMDAVNAEGVEQ